MAISSETVAKNNYIKPLLCAEDNRPFWKKAISAFCGLEEQKEPTPEELELMNTSMIDIGEEKTPAMIVNCAAVLMGCAACFLFGFYAWKLF